MSYLVPREVREQRHPLIAHSPSLESVLSEVTELSREWVLFGPEASEGSSQRIDDDPDQFELPGHRLGDFTPTASTSLPNQGALDRVHQWSSEQSRLVFEELGRLEQRFLWHRPQPSSPESAPSTPSTPRGTQWGRWSRLASTVHDLIALDDQVLEMLFGHEEPPQQARAAQQAQRTAFGRSKSQVPRWDDRVVQRALAEIGVQPAWWVLSMLWKTENKKYEEPMEPLSPLGRTSVWDEVSSMSTEVY